MAFPSKEHYFSGDEYFNPRLQLDTSVKKSQIEQTLNGYRLTCDQVQRLRVSLHDELHLGLQANPMRASVLPMVNTFVSQFPDGTEIGDYLGLDIGGTNLRIIHLKLTKVNDKYEKTIDIQFYEVPPEIRLGSGQKFFGLLGSCIANFVEKRNLKSLKTIPLGFTFSFGYAQYAIDRGEIVLMGIQTDLPDVIGKDPVELLQSAINSLKVPVQVVALANDSTATLIYGMYLDQETAASLILGSGTNIAYLENVENYGKISDPVKTFGYQADRFVVNTEFEVFGDNGCMDFARTKYDFELDNNSLTPHIATYEKITGGAFLGELLRYTLVDLVRNGLLLKGQLTDQLTTSGSLESVSISAIETEFEQNGSSARTNKEAIALLHQLGYTSDQITDDDCAIVTYAGQLITIRSALFIASAVSIFVDYLNLPVVKVGCDGSLFKKHPKMSRLINAYVNKLSSNNKTEVFLADQGSGIGVAMIAATIAPNTKH